MVRNIHVQDTNDTLKKQFNYSSGSWTNVDLKER